MAAERIATGEIYIGLDDEQAIAGLRKIEAETERTLARIDAQEAEVDLKADHRQLKRDLDKATADVKEWEKKVKESDNEVARSNRKRALERRRTEQEIAREALRTPEERMRAISDEQKAEGRAAAKRVAIARRDAQIARTMEAARRRQAAATALNERQSRMLATQFEKEARVVTRLQRRYGEAQDAVRKYKREIDSIKTPRALKQRLELKSAEAVAEMMLIRAELAAMGKVPIHQEIELDINEHNIDGLRKMISAVTDTTVRVGPFTTTLAGLGRTMLWLGPIFSGLTGGVAALGAVLGAALAGGAGTAVGALGALGVSLGGVGFLLPSLMRDFKSLTTLQKAYRTQVLKTGAESEKAKAKLKEYEHALGEVAPTTRRAFLTLGDLRKRWRELSKDARPDFFNIMGEGIQTINHHFDWFAKNTLDSFDIINREWGNWMESLRSREADRILHTLGENGNESLTPLSRALGNIGAGMGRVAAAFSEHLPGLMRGFKDWTEGFDEGTQNADKMADRTERVIGAMRGVGRLLMATARVITAFFSPGVDDGTEVVNNWADSLNELAKNLRTTQRTGIN
jgi:hypothetical protein